MHEVSRTMLFSLGLQGESNYAEDEVQLSNHAPSLPSVSSLPTMPSMQLAPPLLPSLPTTPLPNMTPHNESWPITPDLFQTVLPFHLLFDQDLVIRQMGTSLARLLPEGSCGKATLNECFVIERPIIEASYEVIRKQTLSHFFLRIKHDIRMVKSSVSPTFRGEMVPVSKDANCPILFLCSPHATTFKELQAMMLNVSEIPHHDATHDLLKFNSYFHNEVSIYDQLEKAKHELEVEKAQLQVEKARTDNLLSAMLPAQVAAELKATGATSPTEFPVVTILFSGVRNFATICSTCTPMNIVTLLNQLFTSYDALVEKHNVYKVQPIHLVSA